MTTLASTSTPQNLADFVLHEADLADAHRYDEWLALWNPDEAFYYVPYEETDEPTEHVAIIRDDYVRLCHRIGRLKTGEAYTQVPPSSLSRVLGQPRYEVLDGTGTYLVHTNFVCVEARLDRQVTWAGRVKYTLRGRGSEQLELIQKVVNLVNVVGPMPALTFII